MPDPADRSAVPVWQRIGLAAAFAVFAAAVAALRFRTDSPLWLDEALTVDIAGLPLGDIGPALRRDGHPPLYYWLLHGWLAAFGTGDAATRSLSGVFSVAALPLAYLAGRVGDGRRAGAATLLVVAVSPFALRYATEARMYSLVVLLVLVGHLLVRRATDRLAASLPLLAGVGLVTGLLLLTHYWSFFLVAAVGLVLLGWGRKHGQLAIAARLLGAMAVGSLLFVPWLGAFLEQAAHTGTPWATAARPTVVADVTLGSLGGGDYAESRLLAALLVVLVLVGMFGRITESHHVEIQGRPAREVAGEGLVVVLTLGIGVVVGVLTDSTYAGRYAAVIFPLVAVLVGRGLAILPGTAAPVLAAGSLLLLSVAGIAVNIIDDRTQAGEIAEAVAEFSRPGDLVVTCPDQLGPAVRRALDQEGLGSMPLLAYPALGDGRFVDWYDYVERNDAADPAAVAAEILARAEPDAQIWVVSNGSYRSFEGDCEALMSALAVGRPAWHPVVSDRAADVFEPAGLVVFEAVG